MSPLVRFGVFSFGGCTSIALGLWGADAYRKKVCHLNFSTTKPARVRASAELLAQAVKTRDVAIVRNILNDFESSTELAAALQHRCCHYGTPLGQAIEDGDVPTTEMLLQRLSDEEVVAGNQCSTISSEYGIYLTKGKFQALREAMAVDERVAFDMVDYDMQLTEKQHLINAAVMVAQRCEKKGSSYPCKEMQSALQKRGVYEILRLREKGDV